MLGCWTDNFSLNITDLNDIKNRDGVQTKVNDFGYTDGISYLDSVRTTPQSWSFSYYAMLFQIAASEYLLIIFVLAFMLHKFTMFQHQYVVYFEELIKGIAALPGYFRGQNIRGAPYDSRFDRFKDCFNLGKMCKSYLTGIILPTWFLWLRLSFNKSKWYDYMSIHVL